MVCGVFSESFKPHPHLLRSASLLHTSFQQSPRNGPFQGRTAGPPAPGGRCSLRAVGRLPKACRRPGSERDRSSPGWGGTSEIGSVRIARPKPPPKKNEVRSPSPDRLRESRRGSRPVHRGLRSVKPRSWRLIPHEGGVKMRRNWMKPKEFYKT